jgi:signal transduction histidine kinase
MAPARPTARMAGVVGLVRRWGDGWAPAGAAVLSAVALVEAAFAPGHAFPLTIVLAVATTAPVALARGQQALAALLIMTAVFITLLGPDRPPWAGLVALAWMLYLTGRSAPVRTLTLLGLPLLACALVAWPLSATLTGLTVSAMAALAGRLQRAHLDSATRDATVRAMSDSLVEHVARGERARIARELHDVVAHHISMIAVDAEVGRLTTPGLPEDGAKRLQAIAETARTALAEMRRLLGVLREDVDAEPTRQPQPGLQQLNELLDAVRDRTGASARLILAGTVRPLEPGVELTAYRIVQEALTNARRHAPGAAVDVELTYRADRLTLRIRDNGPGQPLADPRNVHSGHGLQGMRERTAMVGGTLSAGSGRMGGFVVEAVLPTEAA